MTKDAEANFKDKKIILELEPGTCKSESIGRLNAQRIGRKMLRVHCLKILRQCIRNILRPIT